MVRTRCFAVLAFLAVLVPQPRAAEACGGFFCGAQPVDQTAERIVFKVNDNSVTMITQIAYTGAAADFAWVLPLAEIPDVKSLAVFPQRALTALDANTGPRFVLPDDCNNLNGFASSGGLSTQAAAAGGDSGVTVHFRAEVGPYDVAAIESKDPMALYDWLRANSFNVTEIMLPYIRSYTAEGMKFIALKLQKEKDTSDIQPFRFDLPGSSPSIPLRMTALAAEPEMSILVFVFDDQRWNGANWPEVKIDDKQIMWNQGRFQQLQTNWAALVARGIDQAGGRGWVTELAGSSAQVKSALANAVFVGAPDDIAAAKMMTDLIGNSTYVSRLYARLSAEEMTSDPIFHKVSAGDVSNMRMLQRPAVISADLCNRPTESPDPCLFTSCGAGGICRPVMPAGATQAVAGCGCLPGATARTTPDPASVSLQASGAMAATVVCQDVRMSFVNPGDQMPNGTTMSDPCLGFDCGENGSCVAINMTPTCSCDAGFVAVGSFDSAGARSTSCRKPMIDVPMAFYEQRLPDLPKELPGGRKQAGSELPVVQPRMDDLGSRGGALPAGSGESDDCSVAAVGGRRGGVADQGWFLALSLLTLVRRRRARRS